jgi:hypothetical protein
MFDETKHKQFYKFLKLPGLKPSDYFLYKSIRDYFFPYTSSTSSTREVFVLGLRLLYAVWHRPDLRDMVITLAGHIQQEDLDRDLESLVYKSLLEIVQESERKRP